MSSTSDVTAAYTEALIQRLVVDRLAAPGVLDRRQLHATYDRLSQPIIRHSPRSVLRGIEAPQPSAPGLPWVRIAHPSEQGTAAAGEAEPVAQGTGAGVSDNGPSPTAPMLPSVSTGTTAPIASPTPRAAAATARMSASTVARTPLSLAATSRAVSRAEPAPGTVSVSNTSERHSSTGLTSVARGGAGHRAVMRTADRATPAVPASGSLVYTGRAGVSVFTGSPASGAAPRLSAAPCPGATAPEQHSAESLVRVAESRSPDAVSPSPFGGLPASPRTLRGPPQTVAVMRTPAPLIFRKPELSSTAPPPNPVRQPPAITATAPNLIAREAKSAHGKAHAGASHYSDEPKLEQIIERVERHLARQLEIESERQGVRQWR